MKNGDEFRIEDELSAFLDGEAADAASIAERIAR